MTATRQPPAPPRRAGTPRGRLRALIPLILVLLGVGVLVYPVLATQYNNIKQREFAESYSHEVAEADPGALAAELSVAHDYNETLEGVPILDPWLTRVSADPQSGPYRTYLGLLSQFSVMGRVRVPTADIDLPIDHGTSDAVLARGAGHLYGTSLPVGGNSTHAVLTSHTGMATATLFDHLDQVREGDLMFVDINGETLAYEVDQIKIVLPNEIDDLTVVEGADLLTLFTCTPYAVNTHRLLVRGHRVPYTEPVVDRTPEPFAGLSLEPWMLGLLAGAGVGLLLLIAIAVREARRHRRARAGRRGSPPG